MKQRLFTIMIAAVIFLTLVAPVHTVADIALPVDEPVDRYETVTDIGEDSPLTSIADGCSILKYVDEKDFLSNGFKRRVEMEESLSSYVFEREDGTRRLYLLGEDVKFEAADGTVIEKDITLNKTGEGYSTARNNIGLSISESLSDGVQIFFGDNKLSILPADTGVRYSAVLRDNTIVYSDVYGEGTELDFTPTLSGVKQDVVLNSYTGNNVFEYIIFSETLSPFSIENRVFFAENENSDYRFDFGPIYIYDATGHFTSGDMEIAEIDEGRWLITIIAPTEFLESDNTIYPVTIDPTIQVKASDSTAYIEDTTIYSGKPNLNTGSWLYNHTGLISDGYDVGRMLVRIPGLYDSNTTYAYLHDEQIDNVSFCIYEASGSASQRVDLYYYNGTAWTESTATWNNTSPNGYGYLFDTKYPGNDLKTTFDITDLVKGWKNGTYTASKGFMLKSYNESDGNKYKAFDASEGTTSSRRPYVTVDYSPIISIGENVIRINEGDTYTPTVTTLSSGPVYWMSSNTSVATVSSTGEITALKASTSSVGITAYTLFNGNLYLAGCTVYVTIPDGTYFIKNKGTERYADATGYSVGDEVLRWFFHGASNQRWDIEYISGGLYSIKNKMSNLYWGVESLNSTTAITRQYSTLGDSTKWYIAKTSSGAYCFYAAGNLTNGYVIGADPNSNNTIVNMTYTNDSDYKDEWVFGVIIDTVLEGQRWDYWCWVTSARMLTNAYCDVPDLRDQPSAVLQVKGSVVDAPGNLQDAIKASNYYYSGNINANELNLCDLYSSRYSENALISFLEDGHPIYIARGHYTLTNVRNGGHATLIVGYIVVEESGVAKNRFIIYDPWPENEPDPWTYYVSSTDGQMIIKSYEWICNGRNGDVPTDGLDDGIWDRVIVVETSYSSSCLSPVWN